MRRDQCPIVEWTANVDDGCETIKIINSFKVELDKSVARRSDDDDDDLFSFSVK